VSLRVRLVLLCACALAVALGAAGTAAYTAERAALGQELDALLRARAEQVTPGMVQDVLAANDLLPKQRGRLAAHPSRVVSTRGQRRPAGRRPARRRPSRPAP
jgi:hypothetical protein